MKGLFEVGVLLASAMGIVASPVRLAGNGRELIRFEMLSV
jgi:hypothetical protein